MSLIIVMLHKETGSQEPDKAVACVVLSGRESLCDAGGSEGGVFVVIALTCSCDGTLSVSGLRIRPGCQPTHTHTRTQTCTHILLPV